MTSAQDIIADEIVKFGVLAISTFLVLPFLRQLHIFPDLTFLTTWLGLNGLRWLMWMIWKKLLEMMLTLRQLPRN
jgi:hypothetical protein